MNQPLMKIDPIQEDMRALIGSAKTAFQNRLVSSEINFETEAGFAIQILMGNDYALNVAKLNRQSVIDAVTNVGAIGVSLNPAKKQAYLVPRKGSICLDISYMGLIDLAVATGSILWAQCVIVYESDTFVLNGVDKQPTHTRNPFQKDKGNIEGAYSCVKTPQGDFLTHAMPISEIFAIRDRSELWKRNQSGPWKTDEGEMIKKTVIKQAYKYWPKTSPQLEQAINHLNNDGVESIDFKAEQEVKLNDNMAAISSENPYDDLDEESIAWLAELAEEINDMNPETEIEKIYDKLSTLLNSEKFHINKSLNSKTRSALKKLQAQMREESKEPLQGS
jgi:recombination protein RecT